jgi:hypothetical protein
MVSPLQALQGLDPMVADTQGYASLGFDAPSLQDFVCCNAAHGFDGRRCYYAL